MSNSIFNYPGDLEFFILPKDQAVNTCAEVAAMEDKYEQSLPLSVKEFFADPITFPKEEYDAKEYQMGLMKLWWKMDSLFPKIKRVYVKFDDSDDLVGAVYELSSADGKNVILQICCMDIFYQTMGIIFSKEDNAARILKTHTPTLYRFYQNGLDLSTEHFKKECMDITPGMTILSFPMVIDGKKVHEHFDTDKFYDYAARMFSLISRENGRLARINYNRMGMIKLHQDNFSEKLFYYDDMKPFIRELSELEKEEAQTLIQEGELTNHYFFREELTQEGDIPEVEEHIHYIINDYNPYDEGIIVTYYIIHWQDGTEEWSCQFKNASFNQLFETHDQYEISAKLPVTFQSLKNGYYSKFDKGVIIETPKATFFKYEYDGQADERQKRDINEKCKTSAFQILEESSRFQRHIQMREQNESNKRKDNNTDSVGRMFLFQMLNGLFS